MEENIVENIRIERLTRIHGLRFIAVWVNKLMVYLGKLLFKWGYLSEITEVDSLTGLFTRNFFERWSEVIMAQALRVEIPLSFVMIDLDGLKKTNDQDGHKAGDKLIRRMARSLVRHTRKSDVVIRLGGDEFVVILWNCNYEGALKIMEKHLARMEKKEVNFSFGICEWRKGSNVAAVMREADELMYEMKRERKRK